MAKLDAFVGHSFLDFDKDVVGELLAFFDRLQSMDIGFTWTHAEAAEPKALSEKILRLIAEKNVFIGICTAKERVIEPEHLAKSFLRKDRLQGNAADFQWKASDWVIQEIGLAIGLKMNLILLIEDGVRQPGGLQGTIEYINFSRTEPSKAYNKILEMLLALNPIKSPSKSALTEAEPEKEKIADATSSKSDDKYDDPSPEWDRDKYFDALDMAVFKNDDTRLNRVKDAYLSSKHVETKDDRLEVEARILWLRQIFGGKTQLEGLNALNNENPQSPKVLHYLAESYSVYKYDEKAAKIFEESANLETKPEPKLNRFCSAAISRARSGDRQAHVWLITQTRDLVNQLPNGEQTLVSSLVSIADLYKSDHDYLAYSEWLLAISPSKNDLRFSIAYKYSEVGNDQLAIFHYLLIPRDQRQSHVWNNLGVSYAREGLKGKSIQFYRKSEELGGTLAMSNLAHALIEAGFLKEADDLCAAATKRPSFDKQIGTAITKLKETRENEEKKELEILEATGKIRKFMIDYAKATLQSAPVNYQDIWRDSQCDLTITINDGKFSATGSYEVATGGLLAISNPFTPASPKKTIAVQYEGSLTGLTARYSKKVGSQGEASSLLGATEHTGIMILDLTKGLIQGMEKVDKTDRLFEINRIG